MSHERDGYQAYLLRLWRVRYQGHWQWRASIDSHSTGERHSFASLPAFFAFLKEKTRQETPWSKIARQDQGSDSVPDTEEKRYDV